MQKEEKRGLAFICQSRETKAALQEQLRRCLPLEDVYKRQPLNGCAFQVSYHRFTGQSRLRNPLKTIVISTRLKSMYRIWAFYARRKS